MVLKELICNRLYFCCGLERREFNRAGSGGLKK